MTDLGRSAPAPRRHGLSKSRIALFEQCPKRLWLAVHRPELQAQIASTERVFRIGQEVGDAACALVPDGLMIDGTAGMAAAAAATTAAMRLPERRPLFEATFIHAGVVVRVDLLLPEPDGWQVVEVKSSTRVRDYHWADLATQLWVLRGCGVPITRASVRVIDTGFVLTGPGNLAGLFGDEQAEPAVEALVGRRGEVVAQAQAMLAGDEPDMAVGRHCTEPFTCPFDAYCRRDLPPAPAWPATILPGTAGKALAQRWAEGGNTDLLQAEPSEIASPLLKRVHAATLTGAAYHDHAAIAEATCDWAYPRTFLDFESIAFAVPRWIGTRPYSQVPFQFSAHIDGGSGSELTHAEFLRIDGADPRSSCAEALAALPSSGAVIAWNAPFERACLLALAAVAPEHAPAIRSLAARLVDLLPVARAHYYHRDQHGSWSIKAVLPTLAPGMDYKLLEGARSGVEAQDLYMEAVHPNTSEQRCAEIRTALLAYCRHDTLAMVVALERLCRSATPVSTA